MLKTPELSTIIGLPESLLHRWITKGILIPDKYGSSGRGMAHQFDYPKCLALAVAAVMYRSPRGCSPEYVISLIDRFSSIEHMGISNVTYDVEQEYPRLAKEIVEQVMRLDQRFFG
jgi:hypothetical protein